MDVAMIDDRMLPVAELDKAYLDRGLYFGDGCMVLRSYDGRLLPRMSTWRGLSGV